jgi:hypothetical protein
VGRDGRFVFRELRPGTYALVASRNGFFGGGAGQRTPTGPQRPVELADGDRVTDVALRLWRYAAISGRVTDEYGEPVVDLRVGLLERALDNGQFRLQERGMTRTDDRGMYRFGKVTPGHYVVTGRQDPDSFLEAIAGSMLSDMSALAGLVSKLMASGITAPQIDFRARVIPTTFAPSAALAADATTIVIGPGEDRTAVDMRVARIPTYRVAGAVSAAETPPNLSIQLISPAQMNQPAGITLGDIGGGRGGRFDILGVPPGDYVLTAIAVPRPQPAMRGGGAGQPVPGQPLPPGRAGGGRSGFQPAPDAPTWWASQPITITDRDEVGISLVLREGVRISGRIQFDGTATPPAPERFAVFAAAVENPAISRTNTPSAFLPDGTFRTVGLPAGRYVIRLSGTDSPWRLHSVRLGGRDLTEVPIEIEGDAIGDVVVTLTNRPPASLTGIVRTARSEPDPDAVVVIFPVDRQLWVNLGPTSMRAKSSRVSATGAYSIPGLPEGEYFVLAGNEEMLADWLQPTVLEALSARATRVTISESERKTQDLTRRDR